MKGDLENKIDWRDALIEQSNIYQEYEKIKIGKSSTDIRNYYLAKMKKQVGSKRDVKMRLNKLEQRLDAIERVLEITPAEIPRVVPYKPEIQWVKFSERMPTEEGLYLLVGHGIVSEVRYSLDSALKSYNDDSDWFIAWLKLPPITEFKG